MKIFSQATPPFSFLPSVMLVMLWTYAGLSKLVGLERFTQQLELMPVGLLQRAAPLLAWGLPMFELLLAVLLLLPKSRRIALIVSGILLIVFEIYITGMLLSGRELPCTCGGLISQLRWKEHLIFNAVFILLSFIPFLLPYLVSFNKHIHRGVYK
ncbi:MauE/DoxX family redox-associated membrane protein [Pedobacter sp.]|uniref:MauE/DoxX family redox-associated membrane protein n=1 Tax=Pedobacter sp. TaxID=1411316 RepID=UPI003BAB419E